MNFGGKFEISVEQKSSLSLLDENTYAKSSFSSFLKYLTQKNLSLSNFTQKYNRY